MIANIKKLKGNRSGASAAEYALIVSLIGAAIVIGMGTLGDFFTSSVSNVAGGGTTTTTG